MPTENKNYHIHWQNIYITGAHKLDQAYLIHCISTVNIVVTNINTNYHHPCLTIYNSI